MCRVQRAGNKQPPRQLALPSSIFAVVIFGQRLLSQQSQQTLSAITARYCESMNCSVFNNLNETKDILKLMNVSSYNHFKLGF